jgi:hypothetical protein
MNGLVIERFESLNHAITSHSLNGNNRNFDVDVFGQAGDFDRFAGGWVAREELTVDRIDSRKVVHVFHENGGFGYVCIVHTGGLQNGTDVFHHFLGLGLDVALGCQLDGYLPRYIERSVDEYSLAVGSDGGWCLIGINNLLAHS